MESIAEVYTSEVYNNLKPLYANWEPMKPLKLGDFGTVRDRTFVYLGNIADKFSLQLPARSSGGSDQKIFSSKGSTDVQFTGGGGGPVGGVAVKASVEIKFSKENAVFFNAAGCVYNMAADKVALGQAVMHLYRDGQWNREWAVVTDLIAAGATTVAISGGSSASIVIEATASVPMIDLADPKVGLTVRNVTNVGYQIVARQGLIPLIGLCQIQPTFLWWGGDFQPLARGLDRRMIQALEASPLTRTEESDESLFFAQMR